MKIHGLAILAFLLFFQNTPAFSQIRENCRALPEGIVTLRAYNFDSAIQWDTIYGKAGMERFETALALDNGNIVAGGEVWPQDDPDGTRGLLAEVDRRGRTQWVDRHEKAPRMTIRKILFRSDGKGYIAGGTLAEDGKNPAAIRLGWYGTDGAFEKEKIISEKGADLSLENMILPVNGDGFVLVAVAHSRDAPARQNGIIWRLNQSGETIWKRRYDSGLGNRFLGISPAKDETGNAYYIVTGAAQTEDGRTVGLVLKLDPAGTLMWQKEFPRGASALLRAAASYGVRDVIVTGDSEPYGDKYGRSAWIMRIDTADGAPRWQRYFAINGHRLYGRDAVAVADGRASVLLDVEKTDKGATEDDEGESRDMARIVTLSPRGEVLRDEVYTAGTGTRGSALILGPGRHRVVAGYARMSHKADDRTDEANFNTEDGWVVMGSSLEPYHDPCLPRRRIDE